MEKRMRSLLSGELREPLEGDDLLTVHDGVTKTKRRRPSIWTIFTKYGDRCECNYCGKEYYGCTYKNDTKSLWNHANLQCKKYKFAIAVEDKNMTMANEKLSNLFTMLL
ncbi:hypothetical protein ACOSQ3_010182 [Xanthoceras sorbifolium]